MNIAKFQINWLHRYFSLLALLLVVFVGLVSPVYAAGITVTPITWDILGLDSNSPTTGPRLFPVGARVCNTSGTALTDVLVTFNWDSVNTNIDLRAGSLTEITFANMAAGAVGMPTSKSKSRRPLPRMTLSAATTSRRKMPTVPGRLPAARRDRASSMSST